MKIFIALESYRSAQSDAVFGCKSASRDRLQLRLDAKVPEEEEMLDDQLDDADAVGESYGVKIVERPARRSSRRRCSVVPRSSCSARLARASGCARPSSAAPSTTCSSTRPV